MKEIFNLEFITPAFLCGAEQNRAELRVPSIRGELRWWFRVLGTNLFDEREVFGGIRKTSPIASRVVIRTRDIKAKHEDLPRYAPMSDFGYLYYFASVSGKREGINRIAKEAFFSPGTRFVMEVFDRTENPLPDKDQKLLMLALQCFIRLGTLGLRSTRGCGAFCEPDNLLSKDEFEKWIESLPSSVYIKAIDNPTANWKLCQEKLASYLRSFRRDNNLSGQSPSALGFSKGSERESSALRLRPVKIKEGYLPVIIYSDAACSQPSIIEKL